MDLAEWVGPAAVLGLKSVCLGPFYREFIPVLMNCQLKLALTVAKNELQF